MMIRADPTGTDRTIFIVGPPRSGTTLLKEILNRHPEIHIMQETHFMDMIYPLRHQLCPDIDEELEEIVRRIVERLEVNLEHDEESLPFTEEELLDHFREREPEGYPEVFRAMLELDRERHGASVAGEKTPRHLFHVDTLLDWFPGASVFVMVRDGRDFLASYKHYHERKTLSDEERERIAALYHPITTSIKWNRSARLCQSMENHARVRIVQFERLVEQPEEIVRGIMDVLKMSFDPDMLQVRSSNTSFEDEQSHGISSAPVGRWQNRLTEGEQFWFRCINGRIMNQLGYDVEGEGGMFQGLPYLFSFPWQVVRALWKNRHRTRNLWSFLWKRINPS